MKKVTLFYSESCPYCKMAFRMIDALKAKHEEYKDIHIEKIEENENPTIANQFDYYLVPTFYVEDKKLHEGVPSLDKIEKVFKQAI